jgi:cytidylate kinase
MSDTKNELNDLPDVAKTRMQRWLTSPGLREHLEKAIDTGRKPVRTGPYISISREVGTGGAQIARLVAERMGWDLLDKEILDFMAECYGMPRGMLEFVDETRANWLQDVLSGWLDSRAVSHEKFVVYLQRLVYLAAMHGKVVFVGRGVQFILPRKSGIAVRLVAPTDFRIARRMECGGLDRKQAKQQINEADASQSEFYQRFFRRDCSDPRFYDLSINVGRFSPETVSQMIIAAFEQVGCDVAPSLGDGN